MLTQPSLSEFMQKISRPIKHFFLLFSSSSYSFFKGQFSYIIWNISEKLSVSNRIDKL